MSPGEKIQYLRKNILKWNQKKLAEEVIKISKTKGLYQELISKYETGKEQIRPQHLDAFAQFLTHRYKNTISRIDLQELSLDELQAKLRGKGNNEIDKPKKPDSGPKRYLLAIPALVILLLTMYVGFQALKPVSAPSARIHSPKNSMQLPFSNFRVTGSTLGSVKGFDLWLFIERHGKGDTFFWPKSEIDAFHKTSSSDSLTWEREVFHHPNPSDSTLYQNDFAISLFVIPDDKSLIIKNWFNHCKEIGHYPPLDQLQANELIQFRRSMISGLTIKE